MLLLGTLPPGHVAHDRHEMRNRSAFGSHRRDGALVIVEPAVLAAIDETAAPSVTGEDSLPEPGIEGLVVMTRLQEPRFLAQDIAGRVACQRGEGWVDPYDRSQIGRASCRERV